MNEDKIREIALQVFQEQLAQTQFNVSSVPYHEHNQTDSPRLPPTSIINFVALPATTDNVTSGVLSKNNISVSTPPYGIIYPTPVIRGVGAGVFNAFNGGDAPFGSFVCFMPNNATTNPPQLWIRLENTLGDPTWYGVNLPLTA